MTLPAAFSVSCLITVFFGLVSCKAMKNSKMVEATPGKQKVLDIYLMLNCTDCATCRILLLTYLVMIIDKMVQHDAPKNVQHNPWEQC